MRGMQGYVTSVKARLKCQTKALDPVSLVASADALQGAHGRGVHRQRVIFRILELAYRNLGSDLLTLLECYTVAGPATRARPVLLWHMPLQTAQTTVGLARGTMCARIVPCKRQ